eukprot:1770874-Rhodomonas_salina.1
MTYTATSLPAPGVVTALTAVSDTHTASSPETPQRSPSTPRTQKQLEQDQQFEQDQQGLTCDRAAELQPERAVDRDPFAAGRRELRHARHRRHPRGVVPEQRVPVRHRGVARHAAHHRLDRQHAAEAGPGLALDRRVRDPLRAGAARREQPDLRVAVLRPEVAPEDRHVDAPRARPDEGVHGRHEREVVAEVGGRDGAHRVAVARRVPQHAQAQAPARRERADHRRVRAPHAAAAVCVAHLDRGRRVLHRKRRPQHRHLAPAGHQPVRRHQL